MSVPDDEWVLASHRVAALPNPHPAAVRRACAWCQTPIWVMAKNLAHQLLLLCHECAAKDLDAKETRGISRDVRPAASLDQPEAN